MESFNSMTYNSRRIFSITVTNEDLKMEDEPKVIEKVSERSETLTANYKPLAPRPSLEDKYSKVKQNPMEIAKFARATETSPQKFTEAPMKLPKFHRSAIFPEEFKKAKKPSKKNTCTASCIII